MIPPRLSVIHGRIVVEDGRFVPFDPAPLIEAHHRLSAEMLHQSASG